MKKINTFLLSLLFILIVDVIQAQVVISEIMYNNPSTDNYEFVELRNNGSSAVNLNGWALTSAVNFTFPAHTLPAGGYVVVTMDSSIFNPAFGVTALAWGATGGALNNTGETIKLVNDSGVLQDSVAYSSSAPWPNGNGPSLVLCNLTGNNNDPNSWASATTPTGFVFGGVDVLANPGAASQCPTGPVISFVGNGFTLLENAGAVFVRVAISGGTAAATSVTLSADPISTAFPVTDYIFSLPTTITFPAGVAKDTQTVTINLVDDAVIEDIELLLLSLGNPTNGGTVSPSGNQFAITVLDNDAPLTNALVITGLFDTQPSATGAKGFELHALENIPDLSLFGIGLTFNGVGSSGQDFVLPPLSLAAGDCIYVTNDAVLFEQFFGFPANITEATVNFNGDDAVELFENFQLIDAFGDPNTDGTGTAWEYMDGWAYRISGTGPDAVFQESDWTYSGIDALDNVANNSVAPIPFPTCAYSPVAPVHATANNDNVSTTFNTAIDINVLSNDALPLTLTTMTVIAAPANGTATVNGLTNITYTPDNGFCGTDMFTYRICDAMGCDEAVVTIEVACQVTYPAYNIGVVTTVGSNGQPDSLNVTAQLEGIVYGVDLQGVNAGGAPLNAVQFTLIDDTGGIAIFSNNNFGYTVQEGDRLIVRGKVTQFSCLTQFAPDTIILVSGNNQLKQPELTTFLDESFESELLRINNLTLLNPAQWTPAGTGFNVQVLRFGTDTLTMRIDNDTELFNMPAPSGGFHAIGIGGQFGSGNCLSGYQFLPRYAADLIPLVGTNENILSGKIKFFPNPTSHSLTVQSEVRIEKISVANLLGQTVLEEKNPSNQLDVSALQTGVYSIRFESGELSWSSKFVKTN